MTTSRGDLQTELALEQAHIDRVYHHLETSTTNARSLARAGAEIYLTDRADYLREEAGTALFERDAFAYQAAKRLAVLDAEHEGLVFGRLDLNVPETRYIGRLGVRDDEYEPLVIDWRAPAAEPFYRATQANPMDVIRRRVLSCRDDKVIGLEDDLLDTEAETDLPILGEGALMAALTRARGRTMRDIVATIQAEQDEAIRAPYQGFTIIGGGPGTGKTVVALHRAAFLLYTNRARLEKGGVLVVGPSAVFMHYIERVLPGLGEDSVTLRSIGSVAADSLGLSSERVDLAEAASLKGSLRMLDVLRHLVRLPFIASSEKLRVTVKGEVLSLDAGELAGIRDTVLTGQRMNQGRGTAETAAVRAMANKLTVDVGLEPEEIEETIREHPAFVMFMNAWWPMLDAATVLARLADPEVLAECAPGLTPGQRDALVESWAWLQADASGVRGWSVADMALLDELLDMLGPIPQEASEDPLFIGLDEVQELVTTADLLRRERVVDPDDDPHSTFAHIVVDEAQDITPMQWRMLRRRGPQASWTLVGDPAQSSYPDAQEAQQALDALVGRAPLRRFTLSTNYRSPAEVFDLAAKVITRVFPEATLPKAVRMTGLEPKLVDTDAQHLAEAIREQLIDLAGHVSGTIGVVVPPSRFREVQRLTMSDPRLVALEERLIVVTALQAKGLEYDGVLVLSPDEIISEAPGGERVLYVALTRATQRMTVLDVDSSAWRVALG